MLVLSLKLLGLVSSFHLVFLLIIFSVYLGMGIVIPYKAINIKILYLIYSLLSRGFLSSASFFKVNEILLVAYPILDELIIP